MAGRHLSAFALLLACASAPLHANTAYALGEDCWETNEVQALKLERFKTMLLVAMLNCRDQEPGIGADYNRFVRAHRSLIASRQSIVRAHFVRVRGPATGMDAWSNYETALGNRFSDADFTPQRCADAAAEARLAGYVSERGLMDLLESVPNEDVAICPPEPRYVARQAEWAALPRQTATPRGVEASPTLSPAEQSAPAAAAQSEWPDLAPVEPEGPAVAVDPNQARIAEAAPPPPAQMSEGTSEPVMIAAAEGPAVTRVAVAEPVQGASADVAKAAPPVDRVKAVRDAARALREALAALEAEEGPNAK